MSQELWVKDDKIITVLIIILSSFLTIYFSGIAGVFTTLIWLSTIVHFYSKIERLKEEHWEHLLKLSKMDAKYAKEER